MKSTNSGYDITFINERASIGEVYLKLRLYECHYEDVIEEDETINKLIRDKIEEANVMFDFYSVSIEQLKSTCKIVLSEWTNLPIIKEQE